jgi:hypothetical protein
MFITKKHLSRRTFLRGGGATIGLPFLSAMVPAATSLAQTAAAPKPRMGFFYLPHGVIMDNTRHGQEVNGWTPEIEGRNFDFKSTLAPLEAFRDKITVVSGCENAHAYGPVHAITPSTWLSCVKPKPQHAPYAATTVDQIAAQYLGQDTPLPSIELSTEERGGSSACEGTYGCAYGTTISFRNPTTPLPMEYDPKRAFEKIFGRGQGEQERARISGDYLSLLDMVSEEASALKRKLGGSDRAMLDGYLDSVREIERRVQLIGERDMSQLDLPELPVALPPVDEHLALMFDMIAAAYQANMTRVVSLMMAAEVSNQPYPHLGVPDAFHPLSHHAENRANIDKLAIIQRWHSEVFAGFLGKLAEMPDGDAGSVLDNSVFLYGSNMSNSNNHDHGPLPTLIVGNNGGRIQGNNHVRLPNKSKHANVLYTLMDRVDIPVDGVGDSDRQISEI